MGDYNVCHPLWDGGASNPHGILIASFIEDEGLELLNTEDVTHFHSQMGTFTSIDLILFLILPGGSYQICTVVTTFPFY